MFKIKHTKISSTQLFWPQVYIGLYYPIQFKGNAKEIFLESDPITVFCDGKHDGNVIFCEKPQKS